MSAVSMRPKAPVTDLDTVDPPASTARVAILASGRVGLDEARAHLVAASAALDGWYARQTTAGGNYVGDGHDAIRLIDAVTRKLYMVREALMGELRVDEDERAARVDRMIAEFRARRGGDTA
jgi:hypothetical protein